MREAAFKYTIPVQKAEERDGELYLVGLASGPEVDRDGDRVTPEAIWAMADQINSQGGIPLTDRVPYVDAHAKDGVMRELGWVTKAWVTDSGHLGVEVRLDEESPAAVYLHKQVMTRGKKFGMSVAGKVTDWAMEYAPEIGKAVRTFRNVVLSEISNTTRPSWSHSFGTVIAKAIEDAEESESDSAAGENVEDELQTEQETAETPAVDENPEVEAPAEETVTEETTDEAVEEAPADEAEETEAAAEEPVADEAEEAEEEAAEEETTEEAPDEAALAQSVGEALVGFYNNLTEMLVGRGLIQPVLATKSVSQDGDEPTIEKAVSDATAPLNAEIEDLKKSLVEATARIEALENSPAGDDSPELVEKHDMSVDEIAKAMNDMTPSERLRLGLRFGMKPGR